MFVPYFLFLNVKFNVTVPPIYYHTKIAPRIKGYLDIPQPHITHKEARDLISLATYYKILLIKSLVLSFPRTPLTLPSFSNFLSNHWQVIHFGLPTIICTSPLITGHGLVSFFCLPTFFVVISLFIVIKICD